jgi:hypothetical protein
MLPFYNRDKYCRNTMKEQTPKPFHCARHKNPAEANDRKAGKKKHEMNLLPG